jgi:hypothetical protein
MEMEMDMSGQVLCNEVVKDEGLSDRPNDLRPRSGRMMGGITTGITWHTTTHWHLSQVD